MDVSDSSLGFHIICLYLVVFVQYASVLAAQGCEPLSFLLEEQ